MIFGFYIPIQLCGIYNMAEILGVVASGVTIVQIASQVASGILKLRTLIQEVKNIPPTFTHLVQELDILVPLLTEVEALQASLPPTSSGATSFKLCIQHCRRSSQAIEDMASSLNQDINSTRRFKRLSASLKIVLSKNALARLEKELSGAIQLLILAQQAYVT